MKLGDHADRYCEECDWGSHAELPGSRMNKNEEDEKRHMFVSRPGLSALTSPGTVFLFIATLHNSMTVSTCTVKRVMDDGVRRC